MDLESQLKVWGTRDLACFDAVGAAVAFQEAIGKDRIADRDRQPTSGHEWPKPGGPN